MEEDKEIYKRTTNILLFIILCQIGLMSFVSLIRYNNYNLSIWNILLHIGPLLITTFCYGSLRKKLKEY